MKHLLLSLFTLLLLSVYSTDIQAQERSTETVYMLSEGACYGFCPVFTLKVDENGLATFEGKQNCERKGIYQKSLSAKTVEQLDRLFAAANFGSLPDEYKSMLPDLQPKTLGLQKSGKRKTTTFKENRPASVEAIWKAMKEIADDRQGWMPLKPARTNDVGIKEALTSDDSVQEVSVQFKDDAKVQEWCSSNCEKYCLKASREVKPNHYMFAVQPGCKYTAERIQEMIEDERSLIKADETGDR